MRSEIHHLAIEAGNLLSKLRLVVTAAESCTGGGVGYAITSVTGSSAWFDRGFVTYSNTAKREMLGVSEQTLQKYGAVSEEVALEMAKGAIEHSRAHISVAITGIAGPAGGTIDKPVGTVWFGYGQKLGYGEAVRMQFDGNRQEVREQAVEYALTGLIERLQEK